MVHHKDAVADATPDSNAKCLHVETTTWARDSHELFDYEARHVQRRSYLLRRGARMLRSAAEVEVLLECTPASPTRPVDHLVTVKGGRDPTHYLVLPADRTPTQSPSNASSNFNNKKLWLIVKDLSEGRHRLLEGDMIKLGRYKLRVKQLGVTPDAVPDLKWDDLEPVERAVTVDDAAIKQCRICLLDGGSEADPLVCPCHCRGTIEFVHVECLRRWVRGRLGVADDPQGPKVAHFLRQIFCELCKAPFPSAITINGDKVPVVPVPPTDGPFVVLEHVTAPNQPSNRGIHILCLNSRKEVKLGRGHESDVRIADVSISRYHATIRYADGFFVLEDHGSKFGTLVSLKKPTAVDGVRPLSVQVGRTVLSFSVVDPPFEFTDLVELRHEASPSAEEEDAAATVPAAEGPAAAPVGPPNDVGYALAPGSMLQPNAPPGAVLRHPWVENASVMAAQQRPAGSAVVNALHEVGASLSYAFGLSGGSRSLDLPGGSPALPAQRTPQQQIPVTPQAQTSPTQQQQQQQQSPTAAPQQPGAQPQPQGRFGRGPSL